MSSRLAIIGPFTWEPLKPLLERALRGYGLDDEVVLYGFGRESHLWSGADAELATGTVRGAIVVPDAQSMFQRWIADPRQDWVPLEEGRTAAEFLIECIGRVARQYPSIAWIVVAAEPPYPGSADGIADSWTDPLAEAIGAFNQRIRMACRERPGWSVFDRSRLTGLYGWRTMYDPRLAVLARFPASAFGMQVLAERLAAHWAAVRGRMRKVIALDCDNTLWGGVVGEDGVQGIQIGSDGIGAAYLAFQHTLLALEARGIIITLCSRNNPEDVEEVFARRPEMAIPRERIAAAQVGWGPKSQGLRALADTLGLGLDSFVFVDDSAAEREEVRQALPEVAVPEFPKDPAELPAFGYELAWRYFYRISLSEEDKRRTEQYRARAQVQAMLEQGAPSSDFLASLGMRARVAVNPKDLISRNAQLTQKTNQFNLTLRRYTEAEMAQLTERPDILICSGQLADRFGDHGWVGLAILRRDQTAGCWWLDVLLMSCRVLGRGFERAFTLACIKKARSICLAPVRGEYIPGPKNAQASRFLENVGFRLVCEEPSGRRLYELSAADVIEESSSPIELAWE